MEFATPPPERKGQRSERWRDIVKELKDNKGQWAKVGDFSPGVATHIRRGKFPAFLDDSENINPDVFMQQHWEVTTRKIEGGKRNDIYIRWLG